MQKTLDYMDHMDHDNNGPMRCSRQKYLAVIDAPPRAFRQSGIMLSQILCAFFCLLVHVVIYL